MPLRRGRELYSKKYEEAIKLHQQGKSINEIASALDISYSAAYHWIKGLRKPDEGNLNAFENYLKTKGPMPVIEVEKNFPKHNELFLMANKRGMNIRRTVLKRKYAKYSIWYFLDGQEDQLKERLEDLYAKIKDIRDVLRDKMFKA